MTTAVILSPWTSLADGSIALLLGQEHPLPLWCKLEDITGTPRVPCEPNLCVCQFASFLVADPSAVSAWLAAVQSDPRFMLLWNN